MGLSDLPFRAIQGVLRPCWFRMCGLREAVDRTVEIVMLVLKYPAGRIQLVVEL